MNNEKTYALDAHGIRHLGAEFWHQNYSSPYCGDDYQRFFDLVLEAFVQAMPSDPESPVYQTTLCNYQLIGHLAHWFFFLYRADALRDAGFTTIAGKSTLSLDEHRKQLLNDFFTDEQPFELSLTDKLRNRWRNVRTNWGQAKLLHMIFPRLAKHHVFMLGGAGHGIVKDYCREHGLELINIQARQFATASAHPEMSKYRSEAENFIKTLANGIKKSIPDYVREFEIHLENKVSDYVISSLLALLNCRDKTAGFPNAPLLINGIGYIYHRVMACAWRSHGRKVVGFSHGNGFAIAYKPRVYRNGDLTTLSEYVASSQGEKKLVEQAVKDFSRGFSNSFKVSVSRENSYRNLFERHRQDEPVAKIKRIMLIGFPCSYHYHAYHPEQHALPHLHLEITMCKIIRQAGYKITYKSHPDSLEATHGIFDQYVDEIVGKPFEQVYQETDAYLFGTPATTTFGHALLTRKPIICINTKGNIWHPDVIAKLAKRAALIPAQTDGRGHIIFDSAKLLAALHSAPEKTDDELVREYALA